MADEQEEQRWIVFGDLLGRIGIVVFFGLGIFGKIRTIFSAIANWQDVAIEQKQLWMFSQLVVLLFLLTMVSITIFRLRPVKAAQGIEPRITALAGTYLLGVLALVPEAAKLPPVFTVVATVLTIVGFGLSIYVVRWLGRSFSIMAEARRLVTQGPYAIVRHPLYLTEEIGVIAVVLLNFSPLSVLVLAIQWALQLRRMHNEEKVLGAAFPEYAAYAAATPRVIPRLFKSARA
ncbi:isoprenylcysteine carboxylmethyltransferase family protein [Devosia sp.]|uniref:methyltransferase family protein n=1 Tax=Devosia sp. TaxID=1871048 RepID=UPI003267CDDB